LHGKIVYEVVSSYLPVEIINGILRVNVIVAWTRSHGLNGTGNPALSVPPLSLTIEVTILIVNVPIVQRVHERINRNVFIFFFYIIDK
jgi:hypothetical protein